MRCVKSFYLLTDYIRYFYTQNIIDVYAKVKSALEGFNRKGSYETWYKKMVAAR